MVREWNRNPSTIAGERLREFGHAFDRSRYSVTKTYRHTVWLETLDKAELRTLHPGSLFLERRRAANLRRAAYLKMKRMMTNDTHRFVRSERKVKL
jgi:hypothetical protein